MSRHYDEVNELNSYEEEEFDQEDVETEDEEERKLIFNNMGSDDEERQPVDWMNERFRAKRAPKIEHATLPLVSSDDARTENQSGTPNEVKFKFNSACWEVKKVSAEPIPTRDSRAPVKKKFSGARDCTWKKIDLTFSEAPAPVLPTFESETFTLVQKRSRERVPRPPPVEEKERRSFKFTKMCTRPDCKRNGCNYAHTIEEFFPIACSYQARCRDKQNCKFKHDDETKQDFLLRTQKK